MSVETQNNIKAQSPAAPAKQVVSVKPVAPAKPVASAPSGAAGPADPSAKQPAKVPVIRQLQARLAACKTKQQIWKTVCQYLFTVLKAEGVQAVFDDGVSSIDEGMYADDESANAWGRMREGLLVRSQQHNAQLARTCDVPELQLQRMIFATPIPSPENEASGAVAVVTAETNKVALQGQMREVETTLQLVFEMFSKPRPQQAQAKATDGTGIDSGQAAGVARSANYDSLNEFAFALANGLKSKLGCDEVSMGLVEKNIVRVLCISGLDDVYPRSPGSQVIQQAMDECYDLGEPIRLPGIPGDGTPSFSLHRKWMERSAASSVATIPLFQNDECVAVLSLRTSGDNEISDEHMQSAQKLAAPLAPGLRLLKKADRSLSEHAKESVKGSLNKSWLTGTPGKLVFAGLAAITLYMVFGWTNYDLRIPCEVVAENVTEVAAPFPGRIKAAHVEPGDSVHAGQLLVEFNTDEVEAELKQVRSQFEIAEMELSMAISAKDVATAGAAASRAKSAKARIGMLTERLSNATIRAPRAGIILNGDLGPRVGETIQIGEPLIQLADHNTIGVELRLPEGEATYVEKDQIGEFVITSRPSSSFDCKVRRIDPSAQIVDGNNVFLARATPSGDADTQWLRPGMRGLASISTGSQPVWWVWLHKGINWTRLQAWSL